MCLVFESNVTPGGFDPMLCSASVWLHYYVLGPEKKATMSAGEFESKSITQVTLAVVIPPAPAPHGSLDKVSTVWGRARNWLAATHVEFFHSLWIPFPDPVFPVSTWATYY